MRWGSLLSTLLLAGSSMLLPRFLSRSAGLDAQGLTGLLKQVQAFDSGQAFDAQAERQWQALQTGQTDDVPLERLAAIQDVANSAAAAPGRPDVAAALLNAFQNSKPLGEQWRGGLLRDAEQVRRFYRRQRQTALAGLLAGGLAVLAVAVLGALPFLRGLARFVLGMVFGLSGRFLILASLVALAYFGASRLNPWPLLPPEIVAAPVGYMLLSGLFLRMLDANYPVWNTMVYSFLAPVAASLGTWGWMRFQPGPQA